MAEGPDKDDYATVSTTDWLPYAWSINNVAFAEVLHTALAYWQAGRPNEAAHLLKSSMLDGMYLGNSPGNIGQISFYDAARGECYRDFADPMAMMSRAVVQGLYGFNPDALHHRLSLRPGFPYEWDHASIRHSDFTLDFKRDGMTETYKLTVGLDSIRDVDFTLRAYVDKVKSVKVNGVPAKWTVVENSIDLPSIAVSTPVADQMDLVIEWDGAPVASVTPTATGKHRRDSVR